MPLSSITAPLKIFRGSSDSVVSSPAVIPMVQRRCNITHLSFGAAFLLSACGGGSVPLPTLGSSEVGDRAGLTERGTYIVRNAAVCGHCHAADPLRNPDGPLSGGFEFENWRLGTRRAANLTPDSTGLGAWSEEEIVRAMRSGEGRDDHVLAPVMPYAWFHAMSDRDALAIALYLKSQPPVRNVVENDPNLVYEAAKVFFLGPVEEDSKVPVPERQPTAEYGRYLANHVALCGDCHTPRGGLTAGPHMDHLFEGDDDSSFPANPANLTPDPETGIGEWSESDFIRTLRTGVEPSGDSLHAFMPWRQLGRMTDDDLKAIYRYLMTLDPVRHEIPEKEAE